MERIAELTEDYQEVESSNIRAVATVEDYLVVQFNTGAVYRYPSLAHLFHEMVEAPSVGKFFADHIRNENCERIRGEWPDA